MVPTRRRHYNFGTDKSSVIVVLTGLRTFLRTVLLVLGAALALAGLAGLLGLGLLLFALLIRLTILLFVLRAVVLIGHGFTFHCAAPRRSHNAACRSLLRRNIFSSGSFADGVFAAMIFRA
jgi:hypothetical protein